MNLLEVAFESGQLLEHAFAIAAPRDIVLHGHQFQTGAGDGLLTGMQDLLLVVLGEVDFALNHGDAGAFHTGVHAEDRSRHGDAAIGGGQIEMAGTPFGGLHDDAATGQPDGQVAAGLGGGDAGTLAQLDQRAVAQQEHGAGIGGGAEFDAIGKILAGGDRADALGRNLVKRAVHGLNDGMAGAGSVLIDGEPDGDAGGSQYNRGGGPTDGVRGTPGDGRGRHGNYSTFIDSAAGHALV